MNRLLASSKAWIFMLLLFSAVCYFIARFIWPTMSSLDTVFMAIFGMLTAVGTTLITGQSFIDHKQIGVANVGPVTISSAQSDQQPKS